MIEKDYKRITINLHENINVQYTYDLLWPTLSIIDPRKWSSNEWVGTKEGGMEACATQQVAETTLINMENVC